MSDLNHFQGQENPIPKPGVATDSASSQQPLTIGRSSEATGTCSFPSDQEIIEAFKNEGVL